MDEILSIATILTSPGFSIFNFQDFNYNTMENRNYNGLNLLYFRKGIAEFLLKHDDYMDSLKESLNQCELLGQDKLKNIIINNCKNLYNINL